MINTQSSYYSGGIEPILFHVPPFSKVEKIFVVENMVNMIYSYSLEMINHPNKTIKLIVSNVQYLNDDELEFKYFDSQIVDHVDLSNSSTLYSSINIELKKFQTVLHFLICEIPSHIELRDQKINDVIS